MRPLLGAMLLAGSLCSGQEPIRVNVGLVNLSFGVRDARGVPVPSLTSADFDVYEDGVLQKISFFARSVDIPLALGLIADFSGSQEHFIKQHHKDLQKFLREVLGPRDQAFLVCFGNRIRLVSDFSQSGEELVEALRRFEKGDHEFRLLGPAEVRELGTAFYDSIYYSATEKLAKTEHERRALIVFSDGEDNASSHHMLDAIEAAQDSNTVIYCIRYTEIEHGHLTARNKYGTRVMARLSLETGGSDFDARQEDMSESFRRIGEELRSSYELAYHSTNPAKDGLFRKVSIQPKLSGLSVRVKTGYYAH